MAGDSMRVNVGADLAAGAAGVQDFVDTTAQGGILKQAYDGASASDVLADPKKQSDILNKAAVLSGQKGLATLAHSFQKQAGDLTKDTQSQQLNELKIKGEKLGYAGQLIQSASTQEELVSAIQTSGVDTPEAMQLIGAVKRYGNTPEGIQQAKQLLTTVSRTASENIQAQTLALNTAKAAAEIKNKQEDNIRADARLSIDRDKLAIEAGLIPDTPEAKAAMSKRLKVSDIPGVSGAETPAVVSKSPTGASLSQEQDDLQKAGIPIVSGIRTAEKQESLKDHKDSKGNWVTKEGRPVADNSLHLSGNAIDTGPLNKEQRKTMAQKGWYQPIPEKDPNHWEKLEPVTTTTTTKAPEATAVNKKTGAEVSLPTADNPTGTPETASQVKPMTRKGAGSRGVINERLAWSINEASLQAGADLSNIAGLPVGSELSAFAGMAGKTGDSFTKALSSATSRKLNTNEQRVFQQYVAGFEANMSRALGGGYASSSSKQIMDQYKEQIAKEGDSPVVMAAFLARAKQELTLLNKAFKAHPGANAESIKQNNEMITELNKKVTWNVDDVTKALNATGKQSLTQQSQKLTGQSNKDIAASVEAKGF